MEVKRLVGRTPGRTPRFTRDALVPPTFRETMQGPAAPLMTELINGKPQVRSAAIPSSLEDPEASIGQLRKALKTTTLP